MPAGRVITRLMASQGIVVCSAGLRETPVGRREAMEHVRQATCQRVVREHAPS